MQACHLEKQGATGPEQGDKRVPVEETVGWYSGCGPNVAKWAFLQRADLAQDARADRVRTASREGAEERGAAKHRVLTEG